MAFTTVTVTGTATFTSGEPCGGAEINFVPSAEFSNGGTTVQPASAYADDTSGDFSIDVSATDDAGTTAAVGDPAYDVTITDVSSGERLATRQVTVPSAQPTTTFDELPMAGQ